MAPPSGLQGRPARQKDGNDFQSRLERMTGRLSEGTDKLLGMLTVNPLTYLVAPIRSLHRLITSPHTHRSLLGSLILSLIVLLSFLISLVAYISFYVAYVPHIGFSIPVWLQYGEARVPYAIIEFANQAPEIALDQAYDVSLHLTVPSNERNMQLANFMVRLALVSPPPHNATLHRSSRHASLVYEPAFARMLNAIKHFRILFFFSAPPTVQRLKVPLLDHRILQPSSLGKRARIAYARLDVGRQDVYNSPSQLIETRAWGELQVYEAALVFDAHLDGLRWCLYYHPYLSFGFFSAFFFITELATIICTWGFILYRTKAIQSQKANPIIKQEEKSQRIQPQVLPDNEQAKLRHGGVGMTEVDDSSGSEDDHRAVDDSDEQDPEPLLNNPTIKPEADEDSVLPGGSQITATSRSTSTSLGNLPRASTLINRNTGIPVPARRS